MYNVIERCVDLPHHSVNQFFSDVEMFLDDNRIIIRPKKSEESSCFRIILHRDDILDLVKFLVNNLPE